jgi:indolepyruvate ferredoxin oxidoreductase beta subunit
MSDPRLSAVIKLAVLAVGGQGGGVLTGWIETLARASGYACQATSVAGVAQRTGATVYYVEMCPTSAAEPVFSLMPAAGDVGILVAAELMEAGRAIIRGFVTPDRTTLIASTHRALAVSEKTVPGDGIADAAEVLAAAGIAARQVIARDFNALAVAEGSVISASLFGALAASGALPFPREAFEDAIRSSGRGAEASLRAFAAGFDAAAAPTSAPVAPPSRAIRVEGPARLVNGWEVLARRAEALPGAGEMALLGLRKVVEFQDLAYGADYLARLEPFTASKNPDLGREAAKYLANAMVYDDVIRVADLKTRAGRAGRIAGEMGAGAAEVMQVTEYLHPRAEEIVGLLPAGFGRKVSQNPVWMGRITRWFGRGRHLRTDGVLAFSLLYLIGGMKFWRRKTLRHAEEMLHLQQWLDAATAPLPDRPDLSVEILRCRRLIKGYGDTHARGLSKYDRVMDGIALVVCREDAPLWAARLREAALQDEEGKALDGALRTIRSFV